MIGVRYIDELFAIRSIPQQFWVLIREDLRYDGLARKFEGILIFLALPAFLSSVLLYHQVLLDNRFYSLLIASATLFVGFSMNAVMLLLKYSKQEESSALLVDQTRNIVSYLLYLGVVLALMGIVGYILSSQIPQGHPVTEPIRSLNLISSALSVFVLVHFLIVVLFLPARIFTIIEQSTDNTYI